MKGVKSNGMLVLEGTKRREQAPGLNEGGGYSAELNGDGGGMKDK